MQMGTQTFVYTFFFLIIGFGVAKSHSSHHPHHHQHRIQLAKNLFVFGDSYADTGNNKKSNSGGSWNRPYGITFPGRPSGRFSDGRVFTDFFAKSLGLKSPATYKRSSYISMRLRHGVNFAFGGTGVFDTMVSYPNMTTQIDFFQGLLNKSVFTPSDLRNALAHVSLAGNDYSTFLDRGGSMQGLKAFIPKVVDQLVKNLQRIYSLGVKRISVTALQPLGCLPGNTFVNSFQSCNATSNEVVMFHNLLLQQALDKLNKQNRPQDNQGSQPPFVIIDFYSVFSTIIKEKGAQQGTLRFEEPLKPCCVGLNETLNCGIVDAKGNKLYTLCKDPKSHFFWDLVHPTQTGWRAVVLSLQSTLEELHL